MQVGEHNSIIYFREIILFLAIAGIIVPLLRSIKINSIAAYLVIGTLIGPFGLGQFAAHFPVLKTLMIVDIAGVRKLAEFGVVFLLFLIGLELSFDRLWALRRYVFGLGGVQVIVTSIIIALIAYAFGNESVAAIILGASLALSSTAYVMQTLTEKKQVVSRMGRISFSILLFQDLAVVPLLLAISFLAQENTHHWSLEILYISFRAVLVIVAILIVGRYVLRPLFRFVSSFQAPELFMAVVLLVIVSSASITGLSGLSMALGAFLTGALLAESEYRYEIEAILEPFKGLLIGLFFLSIGMGINTSVIIPNIIWVTASVIGYLMIKSLILYPLTRLYKISRNMGIEVSLLLSQGGELALVVVSLAQFKDLIPYETGQFMIVVVSLSMIISPLFSTLIMNFFNWLQLDKEDEPSEPDLIATETLSQHIIIAGFGRVGQTLAHILDSENIPYVALDLKSDLVNHFRNQNLPVFFGDAGRPATLKRLNIEQAQAVILTMDLPKPALHTLRQIKKHWPNIPVFARARDMKNALLLKELGAHDVVPETLESSLQLAVNVLEIIGFPLESIHRILDKQRHFELDHAKDE